MENVSSKTKFILVKQVIYTLMGYYYSNKMRVCIRKLI